MVPGLGLLILLRLFPKDTPESYAPERALLIFLLLCQSLRCHCPGTRYRMLIWHIAGYAAK